MCSESLPTGLTNGPRKVLLVVCLGLWAVSLLAPAALVTGGPSFRGLDFFQQGFGGWRQGVWAWYANPLLFVAMSLCWFRYDRWTLVVGSVGLLLALTSFWFAETLRLAGTNVPPFSYQWGFYLWFAAQVGVLLVTLSSIIVKKRSLRRE